VSRPNRQPKDLKAELDDALRRAQELLRQTDRLLEEYREIVEHSRRVIDESHRLIAKTEAGPLDRARFFPAHLDKIAREPDLSVEKA
jgi:hypothetical protein